MFSFGQGGGTLMLVGCAAIAFVTAEVGGAPGAACMVAVGAYCATFCNQKEKGRVKVCPIEHHHDEGAEEFVEPPPPFDPWAQPEVME